MRTHYCGDLRDLHLSLNVTLCGWAQRRRDHGGVIFIDLRDHTGIVQLVVAPDNPSLFAAAERVRAEYVLRIQGIVRHRPGGTENSRLATGNVELLLTHLEVLNRAEPPPFPLDDDTDAHEDTRLRYRYLDLRRPVMQQRLRLRAKVIHHLRGYLEGQGFCEVETPYLTKATPEGARDYLVPSRTHPGEFFALPQSPQLFKQLLMMGGMDRYYQVVRCFRDEDLRADRQPEFTQLDIETAFLDEDGIIRLMEEMIRRLFAQIIEVPLPNPFPRMTYAEAINRFGIDRPDLRIPLELIEIADLVQDAGFKVFTDAAQLANGRVAALRVPNGGEILTRKQIDDYTTLVGQFGAKGLAYIKVNDRAAGRAGLQSPIIKFLSDAALEGILTRCAAQNNDLIFFGAGTAKVVNDSLAALRVKLGHDLQLVERGWKPVWVVDFPMFDWDANEQRWVALHHPFTAPKAGTDTLTQVPGAALSRAYDLVLNGIEVGGGSIRIHQPELQQTVFGLLGLSNEEISAKFGFLVEALGYGCPPHGGIAFGLDRLVMLMLGASSIREVIAFPKTQSAGCPLTGAPTPVDIRQLRELAIRVAVPPK